MSHLTLAQDFNCLKMFILVVKSNIHSKIISFRFCYQIKQKKSRAPYFMGFAGLLILFIFNGLKVACAIYSSTNNLYYAFIACLFHIYCFISSNFWEVFWKHSLFRVSNLCILQQFLPIFRESHCFHIHFFIFFY